MNEQDLMDILKPIANNVSLVDTIDEVFKTHYILMSYILDVKAKYGDFDINYGNLASVEVISELFETLINDYELSKSNIEPTEDDVA